MKNISSYPEVTEKAKDDANVVDLNRLTPGSVFRDISTDAIYTVVDIPDSILCSRTLKDKDKLVFAAHIHTGEITSFSKFINVEPRFFKLR